MGKRFEHSKVFGHARGKKSGFADLLVTPLVDMFVIIVLFLIANFSATGEVLMMSKDISLPEAKNVQDIQSAPVVTVSKTEVLLSGALLLEHLGWDEAARLVNRGLEATLAESEETARGGPGGKLYVTYDIARQFPGYGEKAGATSSEFADRIIYHLSRMSS